MILAVVLTSLLAIIGVIFLLSSRVDSVSTSAIADNVDLWLSIDNVITQINKDLALDVPGVDPNIPYYDYPDGNNSWLASLEPSNSGVWPHISDLYYPIGLGNLAYNLPVNSSAAIIPEYQPIIGSNVPADADGDGVNDSIWVPVIGKTSSKGKTIYAAVRVVDNSGMLNVNTGYKFDPCDSTRVDGSSQTQINLMGFSWRPLDPNSTYNPTEDGYLLQARANYPYSSPIIDPNNLALYEQNFTWRYVEPYGLYTPYDISDELELRYRFVLNNTSIDTRLENWGGEWRSNTISTPVDSGGTQLKNWLHRSSGFGDPDLTIPPDPCYPYAYYAYRHVATIQNLDRVINPRDVNVRSPYNRKMLNINDPTITATDVYKVVETAFVEAGMPGADSKAAQIAVNLIDYVDTNTNVTTLIDASGTPHFGFETPCIYISELAQNFIQPDVNDPTNILKSYAIELYKPYAEDPYPQCPGGNCSWQLVIYDTTSGSSLYFPFSWTGPTWSGSGQYFVFENDSSNLLPDANFADFEANSPHPLNGAIGARPDVNLRWPPDMFAASYNVYFGTDFFAINSGDANVFMGNVPAPTNTFDPPGLLSMNTTYYWRIDHIAPCGRIATGPVWRFIVSDVNVLPAAVVFDSTNVLMLQRKVFDPSLGMDVNVTVDRVELATVEPNNPFWLKPVPGNPNEPNVKFETHSFQRDISLNKPIRRLWDFSLGLISLPTIGYANVFVDTSNPQAIQAHPANVPFTNVGQIGELFYNTTYDYGVVHPYGIPESDLRINLTRISYIPGYQDYLGYQRLFNYLTVIDPAMHSQPADETRVKGRININTAPWYVIAQLPWVSAHTPNGDLARSIVKYRDTIAGPFKSTGELMNVGIVNNDSDVSRIDFYNREPNGLASFPYLMPADQTSDEFERQNIIFTRLSNLVTVRSDVFTAYILVRIGETGPQKRVITILDRSGVKPNPNYNPPINPFPYIGDVNRIAIQPVPDPR
jgi:hypothetical protein